MQRAKTRQQGNRVDTIMTDTIVLATFLLCTSLLLLMHSDVPRCFPLYFIMSHFPGLSCRFSLEPRRSHYNPQIQLNITMCHSSCHGVACFERGAERKCICTMLNSVHNNSFGAFSLCECSKKLQYSSKLQPHACNILLFVQDLFLMKTCISRQEFNLGNFIAFPSGVKQYIRFSSNTM